MYVQCKKRNDQVVEHESMCAYLHLYKCLYTVREKGNVSAVIEVILVEICRVSEDMVFIRMKRVVNFAAHFEIAATG